jgi:hypothetical protein
MPDSSPIVGQAEAAAFEPRALRTSPIERVLIEELMERVLAAHPAWPWPLIEEEARRWAGQILAAMR